MLEKLDFS